MLAIHTNASKIRSGAYLWETPGHPSAIYISLDVVDRLLQDVMRGFGAVPKRGAEVGGILLGKVIGGDRLTIEIDEYEMIPIEYKRGPSYLLSDADLKAFEETYGRLRHGFKNGFHPVGMFRSHTRDAVGLSQADLDLMAKFFQEADKVVLLIRPYATRVSTAGFYIREEGKFPEGPPAGEFPFRRKELAGEDDAEPPPSNRGQGSVDRPIHRQDSLGSVVPIIRGELPAPRDPEPEPIDDTPGTDLRQTAKSSWMWLPLSFIFLLLGVLLGFQAALTLRPQQTGIAGDPFKLGLSIAKDGDNLNVRWDRQAPAIRAARSGLLVIDDGPYSKTVELDANQLQTGSVVYRHSSGGVKFRLELSIREHATVSEKQEWKQ